MLPFKLILWSHSKLSVQNSSTQQDTAISKHSGWRQMFAGTIRCLFLPFFFFFFVKFNATQCDKLSKAKKPNQTASTVRCLFTTLQKTVVLWFMPLNGCGQPWHKRPVGEITCRKGGREGGNGRNKITPNNMLRRGMHKQLCDPQWQSTSR